MSRSDESDITFNEILQFSWDRLTDNNESLESEAELQYSPEDFTLNLDKGAEANNQNEFRERESSTYTNIDTILDTDNTNNNNNKNIDSNQEHQNVNISIINESLNESSTTTRRVSNVEPVATNIITSSGIEQNTIFPVSKEEPPSSATAEAFSTIATSTSSEIIEAATSIDKSNATLPRAYTLPLFLLQSNEENKYVNVTTALPNFVNAYTLTNTTFQPIMLSAPSTASSSSQPPPPPQTQTPQLPGLLQLIVMENRLADTVQSNYPQIISLEEQINYLQSSLPQSTGPYYLQRVEEETVPSTQQVQILTQQEQGQRQQSWEQREQWEQGLQQPRALDTIKPYEYVTTNYGLHVTQEKSSMRPESVHQSATSTSNLTFIAHQPILPSIEPVFGVEHIELLNPPSYSASNKVFRERDTSHTINSELSTNEAATHLESERKSAVSSRTASKTKKLLFVQGVRGFMDFMQIANQLSKAYLFANPEDAHEFERVHNEKPPFNDVYVPPLAWPEPLQGELPRAYYKNLRRQKKMQERQERLSKREQPV